MPNICDYAMGIEGKQENIHKLHTIMSKEDYTSGPHLFRVFDADLIQDDEDFGEIVGSCAWSVSVCMLEESSAAYIHGDDASSNGTSLERLSKDLELKIEIYSDEPGVGFQEHYVIENGEITVKEIEDVEYYWTDEFDTVEEFNKAYNLNVSKVAYENEDQIQIGGYEEWSYDHII